MKSFNFHLRDKSLASFLKKKKEIIIHFPKAKE